MSYSPPPAAGADATPKSRGFVANALKRKHSFIQFFAMTGILLLSVRSLGQKYRLHDLNEDNYALEEEKKGLEERFSDIKRRLRAEADADATGVFAARVRSLFGAEDH